MDRPLDRSVPTWVILIVLFDERIAFSIGGTRAASAAFHAARARTNILMQQTSANSRRRHVRCWWSRSVGPHAALKAATRSNMHGKELARTRGKSMGSSMRTSEAIVGSCRGGSEHDGRGGSFRGALARGLFLTPPRVVSSTLLHPPRAPVHAPY